MHRRAVLRLEELERRDLPSQSGIGLLAILQPMAGPAIQEAQQIAKVAVQEAQQISGLALQELQQFAQSVLRGLQQFTEPAIPTSQGAGATQTYAPAPTSITAAADHAAEIDSGKPSPQSKANASPKVPSTTTKGPDGSIYYRYGNQTAAAPLPSTLPGGLALEGGGTDIDLLYQWMAARADNVDATVSKNALNPLPTNPTYNGDFLVLGTLKSDAYDSYIYNLAQQAGVPLNSVATLDIPSISAANSSFVTSKIESASAIFIMGGDQSTYVNDWQGTAVQTALDDAAARGVPIGGTSAGVNILSQYIYSAENTSGAVSSDVLANPYSSEISLDKNFLSVPSVPSLSPSQPVAAQPALPYLENTIIDPHFFERDRMGRTVTFLARLVEDPQWTAPSSGNTPTPLPGTMAIGIDQSTALLIDTVTNTVTTAGDATVIGNSPTNHLYFLTTTGTPPTLQSSNPNTLAAPLSWGMQQNPAIQVYRATVGDNLTAALNTDTQTVTWTFTTSSPPDGPPYTLWVTNGTVNSSQANGAIY